MARSELTLPEVRYRRLFETARDGILILDARTGQIEDANPFMTELLGYTRAELLGKPLWEIGLLRDVENNRMAFRSLQQDGIIRYDNLPLQRRDGTVQEVEFVSNVYDENGRDTIQCNIRDITDRRRLERRLEEYARTSAETDRRKSEFLAILSHELRNPMAAISCALPLLAHATLDDSQTRALAVVNRQLAQLTRLVNDLLDVNRIATGHMTMARVPISVDEVVNAAIESSSPVVQAARHRLNVVMPDEQLWIEVDPGRISQVIDNLLTNAAKYTPRGGSIALNVSRAIDHAVFRVTDTGMGIPEEQQKRLFDMFVRVDADGPQTGLGVGLAIAKRIVESHGGTIEAHSAGRGRGAEFVVRLPLVQARDRVVSHAVNHAEGVGPGCEWAADI